LNDSDWKDVSWEDIGNDKEYDLINVVSNKSSMSKKRQTAIQKY